jgi:transcriptional regulator with XRE-family HTH domain
MDDMDLHEKIRYTRGYRGRSRQELADYLGMSVSSIGHIETGIRAVQPAVLKEISKYLDIPWEFYMDDDVQTVEEFFEDEDVKKMLKDKEEYGGYFKLIDTAKDNDVTPEEFKECLELIRRIKKRQG